MPVTTADSKRRIVLPKDVVEKHGRKFVLVRLPDEILLKPLSDDPVKALREEGKKIKVSAKQFEKEVEEYVRRRT